MLPMATLLSLNIGRAVPTGHSDVGVTGIDKRPVDHEVEVTAPAERGTGGSAIAGDAVCDKRHHGGPDQALYAYAREDLDTWSSELGRHLASGTFGENLTTAGLDLTGALIGERWRVGGTVLLEVSTPRIPCRTFAGWLGERGWVRRFTERAVPGAYLRVIEPGRIRAGDRITVVDRPDHDVTISVAFRALTIEAALLPRLLAADALPAADRDQIRRRLASRV